ncbi:MAG: hypothetical protein AAFZ49_00145 [Cyanobacteria bacterium J06659_2]
MARKKDVKTGGPQEVGGEKISSASAAHDSNRGQTVEGESGGDASLPNRVPGIDGSIRTAFWVGGIVAQLIRDANDRLGEVEECIEWYQREAVKCRERLTELEEFKSAIQTEAGDAETE